MKTPKINALLRLLVYVKHHPQPKDATLQALEKYASTVLKYAELELSNDEEVDNYIARMIKTTKES
ncbi:hypothetical protein QUR06_000253 [Escherichia coli]|nr:hypothetical protein [Escherichia coli]